MVFLSGIEPDRSASNTAARIHRDRKSFLVRGRERSRTPHRRAVHTAFEAGLAPSQFLFRALVPREGIEPPAKSTGLQPAAPPWCVPGIGDQSFIRVRAGS